MEALRLKKHVDSGVLHIAGLEELNNRDVEIIILVEPNGDDAGLPPKETQRRRLPGWAKGLIWISDDFHKPLDGKELEEFYK